jgi:Kdo2-lipid IVA lauroyltransferase/acyltransferase
MGSSLVYYCFYGLAIILSLIPYQVGQFLGKMFGAAAFMLPLSRKKSALMNISRSFDGIMGEEETKNVLRRVFLHFGRIFFEIPYMLRFNPKNLLNYFIFEDEQNLLKASRRGKGVLLLTAHFGNWELLCAAIALRFGPCALVVRPPDFQPAAKVITELRALLGVESIHKDRAMRRLLAMLKENKFIAIMLDQNVDWYEGAFVDFLGRLACTNKGLALMALKTGASVVPAFSVRQRDGRHRIIFEKEVALIKTGDKMRDVEENTALFTKVIEAYVRKHPDHWLWLHHRWKTLAYCPLPETYYSSTGGDTGTPPFRANDRIGMDEEGKSISLAWKA